LVEKVEQVLASLNISQLGSSWNILIVVSYDDQVRARNSLPYSIARICSMVHSLCGLRGSGARQSAQNHSLFRIVLKESSHKKSPQ
jgi:hypothetical protein